MMQPWLEQWDDADENVVEPTEPHTDSSFKAYLTWYLPQTRARLVFPDMNPQPHQASLRDGCAQHQVEALAGAVSLFIVFANGFKFIILFSMQVNFPLLK